MSRKMLAFAAVLVIVLAAGGASAQETPVAVVAIRLDGGIVLDGKPDEPGWEKAPPFTEFIQQVPKPGAPATDRTDVRVLFDDEALYFGLRAFQSADVPVIANELRRDVGRIHNRNDTFTVALDTFFDRRNGNLFIFNALGAVADWAGWDEGRVWSQEWDTVWDVKTSLESWGWSAEMRLPFRSLRFKGTGEQRWGITFRRIVLGRNEWAYSTLIRPEWGDPGIGKFSAAAELRGLVIGQRTLNLELTPYVLGGAMKAGCEAECEVAGARDVGMNAKYGVTPNVTLDLTYNTDFSQVARGLIVNAGSYGFTDYAATWTTSPSRRAIGILTYRAGGYYDGTRREFAASSIIVKTDRHFYADLNYQVTDVSLPAGSAVAQLFGVRLNYSATTRVFNSTLLQWNNSTREFNANVRLNWIYRPGSNLYVVYTRASGILGSPIGLQNQSVIVKLTRLLQM